MSVCPNNNQAVANFNSFCVIGKGAHARLTEMIATKISIGGDVSQRVFLNYSWVRMGETEGSTLAELHQSG